MFWSSAQDKLNKENIDNFNSVLAAIKTLIALQAWDKVATSILDIRQKEKDALNIAIRHSPAEEDKLTKVHADKEKKIKKLENIYLKKSRIYKEKVEKQKLKIQLQRIKSELNSLVKSLRYKEALSILTNFLEENRWNTMVSSFYNSEKKKLRKKIVLQERRESKRLEQNTQIEAQKLLGKKMEEQQIVRRKQKKKSGLGLYINKIKEKLDMRTKIRTKIMLDEVTELINAENEATEDIVRKKLTNIHAGLVKEINGLNVTGYEVYGKMLWADKISWDTFGLEETKKSYKFFLGDATWHGVRAWLIVSMLSKSFEKNSRKYTLDEMVFNINNELKQDLASRNFVTGIFFSVNKSDIDTLNFVWMGHEPMMIYRRQEHKVLKVVPWWLAAGIRIIPKLENVKPKEIPMWNGDLVLTYTDGIVEAKNFEWEQYGFMRLQKTFHYICEHEDDPIKIYNYIVDDLKFFKWWSKFDDDVTLFIIKRNHSKDTISDDEIDEIQKTEKLTKADLASIKWLANDQVEIELNKIKEKRELVNIIKTLENLYVSWEILKLKQECIRFIKDWYIDKKINFYLKKALANEQSYKIKQKNQKLDMKYKVLEELYKKWDYSSVIAEVEDVISKDWNI